MRTYTHRSRCHPRKSKKNKTCYEDNDLIYLRDEWNRKNPSKKIVSTQKETIYQKLREYQEQCKNELCWLKMVDNYEKKNSLMKNNFAILQPKNWKKNEKEWLSNYDISNVLKQYKEAYSNFDYLGPTPIDFDRKLGSGCVKNEICRLSIAEKIRKKINKIGISINLDVYGGYGLHWVTLFIDLEKKFIFY